MPNFPGTAWQRWLRTGDIATISSDGYLSIIDHTKDLIKSGGEWISAADVEAALAEHQAVSQVAVIAGPAS
jgi:fatty-acyl-CoA synthase